MLMIFKSRQCFFEPVGAGGQNLPVALDGLSLCRERHVAEKLLVQILAEGRAELLVIVRPGKTEILLRPSHPETAYIDFL